MVSIIVPVYNGEKYLEKLFDSTLCQTYKDFELIVIDDCSTDKSCEIINRYLNQDARIVFKKNQKQSGASATRNNGLEIAQGEFIMFFDCDDYTECNFLEKAVDSIEKYNVDLVMFSWFINDLPNDCNFECIPFETNLCAAKQIAGISPYMGGYLWNKIYKRNIIRQNSLLFDESCHLCEDALFNQQYLKYCTQVAVIPECYYHYRVEQRKRNGINYRWLSVLNAYKKIIILCDSYNDEELNTKLKMNYYRHIIDLLYHCNKENKKEFGKVIDNAVNEFKSDSKFYFKNLYKSERYKSIVKKNLAFLKYSLIKK